MTESAATHEIEEAATAGTPEAAKVVTDTEATQAASLPMSRAARRKAAAADTEAKGPPATAGPLPEAAVAMTEDHTHQREAPANGAVQHGEAARLSISAAVSTTGNLALFQVQEHLVRAASPDHTQGANDINVDGSRTLTATGADHKNRKVRVARTQRSNKKPK